eukprot:2852938-Amphidinium_carterae.1
MERESVLKGVRQSWDALREVDEVWKRDREVVLTAVREHGRALQFAAEALKRDPGQGASHKCWRGMT